MACQNSCRASDLGFYPRHSCSFASSICSWSGCLAGWRSSPAAMFPRTWKTWCSGTRSRSWAARSPARNRTGLTGGDSRLGAAAAPAPSDTADRDAWHSARLAPARRFQPLLWYLSGFQRLTRFLRASRVRPSSTGPVSRRSACSNWPEVVRVTSLSVSEMVERNAYNRLVQYETGCGGQMQPGGRRARTPRLCLQARPVPASQQAVAGHQPVRRSARRGPPARANRRFRLPHARARGGAFPSRRSRNRQRQVRPWYPRGSCATPGTGQRSLPELVLSAPQGPQATTGQPGQATTGQSTRQAGPDPLATYILQRPPAVVPSPPARATA